MAMAALIPMAMNLIGGMFGGSSGGSKGDSGGGKGGGSVGDPTTGAVAAANANKVDPNLLAMIGSGSFGKGHDDSTSAYTQKGSQALDQLAAQQQLAPLKQAQKDTGRAVASQITTAISPELAAIKAQLQQQDLSAQATAEHRKIVKQDANHAALMTELRTIKNQLAAHDRKVARRAALPHYNGRY